MEHATVLLQSTVYTLIVLLYWLIAKKVVDKMTVYDDDYEIENKQNFAMGLMRSGLYLGIAIGMAGALAGNGIERSFWKDIVLLMVDGAIMVPLIIFARYISDKLILRSANNDDEIGKNNIAVGVAEFGSLVGIGLVLNGSFTGEGKIWSSIPYFLLGQTAFVIIIALIEKFGKYNVRKQIAEGNVAAGIFLASKFIALGLIMRISIVGPSQGWLKDLESVFLTLIIALPILLVFNRMGDWIFLPNSKDKEQIGERHNPAALILAAGIEVGLAIIVSTVI